MRIRRPLQFEYWLSMPEEKFFRLMDTYAHALRQCSLRRREQLRNAKVLIPRSLRDRFAQHFVEIIQNCQCLLEQLEHERQEREKDRAASAEAFKQYQRSCSFASTNETLHGISSYYAAKMETINKRLNQWELSGKRLNHLEAHQALNCIRISSTYLLQIRRGYIRAFDFLLHVMDGIYPLSDDNVFGGTLSIENTN